MATQSLEFKKMSKTEEELKNHNTQASLRFLENLYQEILICSDINELKDPIILNKFKQVIEYLSKNYTYTDQKS